MADSVDSILVSQDGPVTTVTINRPEVRNALDRAAAKRLAETFRKFDADDTVTPG